MAQDLRGQRQPGPDSMSLVPVVRRRAWNDFVTGQVIDAARASGGA